MGQSLWAKKMRTAERYTKMCQKIRSNFMIMMSPIYFGATLLAGMYTDNGEIIQNTLIALSIVAFVQPFQSHQLITSGALRGAGDTVWPLIAIFIGSCVIRLSLGYGFETSSDGDLLARGMVFIDQFIRDMIIPPSI